ncbi:MAG: cellulase family glycosylhydrolase [Anaerolineae bacterium]|jgi:hypothetical protein
MGIVRAVGNHLERDGELFVPWGVNHFWPRTGWAPQLWKTYDPAKAERDFAKLAELGCNVARVFGTWQSFCSSETEINPEGFDKFDSMLEIAWKHGIMLHPTGPDHWEGFPAFMGGEANYIQAEPLLRAAENYWHEMATRYRNDERIFAFDLLNEPSVRVDSHFLRAWREIAEPKKDPVAWPVDLNSRPKGICDEAKLEAERLRWRLGDEWIRRMCEAIRSTGTETAITVGYLQFTFPFMPLSCGFHLAGGAELLDFISIHFYPGNIGLCTDYRWELDQGALWASYAASFGKPMIFGEFGWLGGNEKPFVSEAGTVSYPPSTQEQSAVWCRDLVEATRPYACGWLCWGSFDVPESRDCTRHSGLLDADGNIKAWGRTFAGLGARVKAGVPEPNLPMVGFELEPLLLGRVDAYEALDELIYRRRVEGEFSLHEA